MEQTYGQKGIVVRIPEEVIVSEIYVGMNLTVRGELADMWICEREDGTQAYIPKDCFNEYVNIEVSDLINDCMDKIDFTLTVASSQNKQEMVKFLQDIKERLNDLSMEE